MRHGLTVCQELHGAVRVAGTCRGGRQPQSQGKPTWHGCDELMEPVLPQKTIFPYMLRSGATGSQMSWAEPVCWMGAGTPPQARWAARLLCWQGCRRAVLVSVAWAGLGAAGLC